MLIRGSVKDLRGKPIAKCLLDIWETNGNGKYDMQDDSFDGPDCRGKFYTDEQGKFYINGVKPVDYPVPFDGPVGDLLELLNRQAYRPAHIVSLSYFFSPFSELNHHSRPFMTLIYSISNSIS